MPPASPIQPALRDAVLAWYDARGRALPFRGSRDPYAILVSEAMAQQTQIARAAEAWVRFIARFPTVAALAAAAPADVLREWRGLGYNRRAINLWRAARLVLEEHGGELPRDVAALERLPGVGPYTARAVAAIAFGAPVGAVDTNVRRVLGRALTGADDALPARELQALADASVAAERPGDWTHALMDVGATYCRPRRPDCEPCPARPWCAYARSGGPRSGGRGRDGVEPPGRVRAPAVPAFAATSRWLRGRILDRLRDAEPEAWTAFDEPIGLHPPAAVADALSALVADGLAERHPDRPSVARLPLAEG